ncbi:hypothetical protein J6590_006513 [Homalodisca vitripennis]|nr:hypothetical protein J6590_090757 [Homalodisca vitripennis]KAG8323495.1 hypothetical protein J6590_006513 [Homalodisca vitripennis]
MGYQMGKQITVERSGERVIIRVTGLTGNHLLAELNHPLSVLSESSVTVRNSSACSITACIHRPYHSVYNFGILKQNQYIDKHSLRRQVTSNIRRTHFTRLTGKINE